MKKTAFIPVFVNAATVPATSEDGWRMIAPYGDHPSRDRKMIQRFGREQAKTMVVTFNSLLHKLGNGFRGVAIYHGHPDVLPEEFPDDRRLGKIVALQDRDDGLYGKPELNAIGKENEAEGWWPYPSPAWLSPPTKAPVVYPDELMSVGMVPVPNITGSAAWTNSADPDADEEESPPDQTDPIMNKKKELCELLKLDPATATDDQILDAVKASMSDTAAKKTAEDATAAANTEKGNVETAFANSRKAFAEAVVDTAVTAGKLTEGDRVATVNSLSAKDADVTKLTKDIYARTASVNSRHLDLGGRKVSISSARDRRETIQTEVNSRMSKQSISYDAAYASVKRDPQFAPLFEAMKQPGTEA